MPAIILLFGLAAAVWATILIMRGSLLVGCFAYLVLVCVCGEHFWKIDLGVSLSLDRLFLVGLFASLLWQWRVGQLQPKGVTYADVALLGLLSVIGFSTWLHAGDPTRVGQEPPLQHWLNGYLIPSILYLAARQSRLDARSVLGITGLLIGFGVYLALTGIFEIGQAWSFVFPKYIADPRVGLHFGRARGPMVHSVSYGLYLAAALIGTWLIVGQTRRSEKWAWACVIPLFLVAIFLTKTRTVWMGAGCGMLLVLATTLKGKVRTLVLGGLLAGSAVVGLANVDRILSLQREGTVKDTRKSASMRASFTYVSWKMFLDQPLLGVGFGRFREAKLPYLDDRTVDLHLNAIREYVHHNTFLSLLTETGLVGLCFYLCLLAAWTWQAVTLWRRSDMPVWARRQGLLFCAVLVVAAWQMLGHEITFTPIDHGLLFLLAGMVVALQAPNAGLRLNYLEVKRTG